MTPETPRLLIQMGSFRDFDSALAMVRATGAVPSWSHEFVIDGSMTVPQVAALLKVVEWRGEGGFTVTTEPEQETDWSLRDDASAWYARVGKYKPPEPPPCPKCQAREAEELRRAEAAKNRPARHGAKWEPEEEQQILQEYHPDKNVPAIARAHQRTEGAIWSLLRRLGIPESELPEQMRGYRRD